VTRRAWRNSLRDCLRRAIEVHRAAADLTLREGRFPAGTYVVRLDQPYRDYAVDLLTAQNYPKDGGEAYDDISWELPAHYHLAAIPTADPQVRAANLTALSAAPHPQGQVSGSGPVYLLRDSGQEGLLEARYQLARFRVSIAERAFRLNDGEYPAGSWILAPQAGLTRRCATRRRSRDWILRAPPRFPTYRATQPPCRVSDCGCRGPTPIP